MHDLQNNFDIEMMELAIQAAQKGNLDAISPNPRVGAIIVEDTLVVSEGYHQFNGGPHAEVEALMNLGRKPKPGAKMYVTLEPCCTHGRTGACTDRIIEAEHIQFVIIGAIDPNPVHRGKGVEILRQAGIEVVTDCLGKQCEALNPEFNQRMRES